MPRPKGSLSTKQARAMAAMRKTRSGGDNGGRPKSKTLHCRCGAMTIKRALARKHRC